MVPGGTTGAPQRLPVVLHSEAFRGLALPSLGAPSLQGRVRGFPISLRSSPHPGRAHQEATEGCGAPGPGVRRAQQAWLRLFSRTRAASLVPGLNPLVPEWFLHVLGEGAAVTLVSQLCEIPPPSGATGCRWR